MLFIRKGGCFQGECVFKVRVISKNTGGTVQTSMYIDVGLLTDV
jgi:hypothetical protein